MDIIGLIRIYCTKDEVGLFANENRPIKCILSRRVNTTMPACDTLSTRHKIVI
jgi:hypothetical protein